MERNRKELDIYPISLISITFIGLAALSMMRPKNDPDEGIYLAAFAFTVIFSTAAAFTHFLERGDQAAGARWGSVAVIAAGVWYAIASPTSVLKYEEITSTKQIESSIGVSLFNPDTLFLSMKIGNMELQLLEKDKWFQVENAKVFVDQYGRDLGDDGDRVCWDRSDIKECMLEKMVYFFPDKIYTIMQSVIIDNPQQRFALKKRLELVQEQSLHTASKLKFERLHHLKIHNITLENPAVFPALSTKTLSQICWHFGLWLEKEGFEMNEEGEAQLINAVRGFIEDSLTRKLAQSISFQESKELVAFRTFHLHRDHLPLNKLRISISNMLQIENTNVADKVIRKVFELLYQTRNCAYFKYDFHFGYHFSC